MDKNCIIASVVAGVAMHVVNWLVGMVPGEFFAANFGAMWTWQAVVGSVFMGAVLATVLGWKGAGDPADGAKAGATVGVLMGLGSSFAGMEAFDVMALVGGIVAGAVVYGIAGATVSMTTSGMASDG